VPTNILGTFATKEMEEMMDEHQIHNSLVHAIKKRHISCSTKGEGANYSSKRTFWKSTQA